MIRKTFHYGLNHWFDAFWKRKRDQCPNCNNTGHVVMERMSGSEPVNYLMPCPCCNKTFAIHLIKRAA